MQLFQNLHETIHENEKYLLKYHRDLGLHVQQSGELIKPLWWTHYDI